jgi:hypothetical protein
MTSRRIPPCYDGGRHSWYLMDYLPKRWRCVKCDRIKTRNPR